MNSINQINWNWKTDNIELFKYYQNLIHLRKSHPAFRMLSNEDIQKNIEFIDTKTPQLVAFLIKNNANGDEWKNILVVYNGSNKSINLKLPEGFWTTALSNHKFEKEEAKKVSKELTIHPISSSILFQK